MPRAPFDLYVLSELHFPCLTCGTSVAGRLTPHRVLTNPSSGLIYTPLYAGIIAAPCETAHIFSGKVREKISCRPATTVLGFG
jgi:hypothetical protein